MLDVALLDLLHERLALEEVTTKIGGKQAKNGEKLTMGAFLKRESHGAGEAGRSRVTATTRTSLEKGAGVEREYETKMVCPPFASYSEWACAS